MCGLDIAEKRKPQDGRFSIKVEDKSLDVRLATMPIYHGEAIVLRLLDQSSSKKTFAELGMPPDIAERFKALIERSAGMILVTGPTGSGKTTTLYAALQHVNSPATKIITAEDPIEYRLERVNQVQVNAEDRPDVLDDPAHGAAPRPRHRARRRDARPGDGGDRVARGDDGPPRVLDSAHAKRRLDREPVCSTWARKAT